MHQVLPLPEAAAYQVLVREKEQRGRQERAERYGIRKRFWQRLLFRAATKTPIHANIYRGSGLTKSEVAGCGTFSATADKSGQFQRWTKIQ